MFDQIGALPAKLYITLALSQTVINQTVIIHYLLDTNEKNQTLKATAFQVNTGRPIITDLVKSSQPQRK